MACSACRAGCTSSRRTTALAPAAVLLGRSANGRIEWKAEDGRTLKELQEAEAAQ
jgi:heterodisulfide reductase subunit C